MVLLNYSKQWSPIDAEILTVANVKFKLCTYLNSTLILNSEDLIKYAGYKSRYIHLRRRKKVSMFKEAKPTLIVQNFPHQQDKISYHFQFF